MELDQVAEELDEDDLALRGVDTAFRAAGAELHGSRAHGDDGLVPDREIVARREHARPDAAVLEHETIAVAARDRAVDDVVVAHEAGDELGLRPGRDRQRVGHLLDARVVHDDDPVGHRERFFLVVRHVDEGQPELALEVPQLDAHPQLQEPVEVAERLVEQERLRLRDQHARQSDALLLPARELPRPALAELLEADHVERFQREPAALPLPHPVHLQPELDVLEHRPVREQREVLEDGRRGPLVGRERDERLSVEEDVPARREVVAADHPERGRLAATRRAEQDHVLAVVDVQVEVVHGERPAGEHLGDPLEVEAGFVEEEGAARAAPSDVCPTASSAMS